MDQPTVREQSLSQHFDVPQAIHEACQKIYHLSSEVRVLGRLDDKRSKLASSAVRVMTLSQTARPFKIYQSFLFDVHRASGGSGGSGGSMVVLSSASLGKDKIVQLNAKARTALVEYIARHKSSLDSPALCSLAADFKVPRNEGLLREETTEYVEG